MSDRLTTILSAVFLVVVVIVVVIFLFNKGNIDRFMSKVNEDKTTAKDQIYQTGNVRVYKFVDQGTTCYIADKQSLSTAIWCK